MIGAVLFGLAVILMGSGRIAWQRFNERACGQTLIGIGSIIAGLWILWISRGLTEEVAPAAVLAGMSMFFIAGFAFIIAAFTTRRQD